MPDRREHVVGEDGFLSVLIYVDIRYKETHCNCISCCVIISVSVSVKLSLYRQSILLYK